MNELFARATGRLPQLYAQLMEAQPFKEKGVQWQNRKKGIYVFFDEGLPVHVGRTRNLKQRLRGHTIKSHNSASFAFKLARRAAGVVASYKPIGSRAHLVKDDVFGPHFHREVARVKEMEVRFLELDDPVLQYLLELYACLELKLPLEEFDTH